MPLKLKIVGASGCCPCPSTVGCSCNESCSLECQKAGGLAELCGFSEFAEPSVPPKKYRRREVMSDTDPFKVCSDHAEDCPITPHGGGEEVWFQTVNDVAVGGEAPYINVKSGTWRLEYISTNEAGNVDTYRVVEAAGSFKFWAGSNCDPPTAPPDPPCQATDAQTATVRILGEGGVGIIATLGLNETVTFASSQQGITYPIQGRVGSDVILEDTFTPIVRGTMLPGTADSWDIVDQYHPVTCEFGQTDSSFRQVTANNAGLVCGRALDPEEDEILCGNPSECYGAGLALQEPVAPGLRVYQGTGCVETAPGVFKTFAGAITESLSDEDTEQDAIEREAPEDGEETWSEADCLNDFAFITERDEEEFAFGFSRMRVRLWVLGATVGQEWEVSITFQRRALGSGGTWILFATEELEVTITGEDDGAATPWIEVPNEAGWETRVHGCTAVLVPPP